MKLVHIKSQTSVALPIYTSDLSHLSMLEEADVCAQMPKEKVRTPFPQLSLVPESLNE